MDRPPFFGGGDEGRRTFECPHDHFDGTTSDDSIEWATIGLTFVTRILILIVQIIIIRQVSSFIESVIFFYIKN